MIIYYYTLAIIIIIIVVSEVKNQLRAIRTLYVIYNRVHDDNGTETT